MTDALTKSLERKRDRAIAIILRYKDEHLDPYLPDEVATNFRKVVLDQLNELHDLTMEVVESGSGAVFNEHYLTKIDEIYEVLVVEEG